jgi:hypothetical protein
MGLVDDDRLVAGEIRVLAGLGQQDAVGHQLDQGVIAGLVGEAHLIAHLLAQRHLHLLGQARGHRAGRQAPRLGMPDQPAAPQAQLQAQLGQLGGFAGAGLAGHHHHLMVAQRREDLATALGHRQRLGVRQGHRDGTPAGRPLPGAGQRLAHLAEARGPRACPPSAAGPGPADASRAPCGRAASRHPGHDAARRGGRRRKGWRWQGEGRWSRRTQRLRWRKGEGKLPAPVNRCGQLIVTPRQCEA